MKAGTYKYKIVGSKGKYRHQGARTEAKSKRSFESRQAVTNHVRALCQELSLNSKEVK